MFTVRNRAARKEVAAGVHLPYLAQIDDHTILTRHDQLMQIIKLDGLPFETIARPALDARLAVRDAMLQSIGSSRFAIVHHVVRHSVEARFEGRFGDPFSAELDLAWRDRLATRRLFVNDLYLTLIVRPLRGRAGWAERLLGAAGAGRPQRNGLGADLRLLSQAREQLMAALEPYGPQLLTAYDASAGLASQQLEFLATLFNGTTNPMLLPTGDLGHAVARRTIGFGADTIELGPVDGGPAEFAAILSAKDYPSTTSAGMLDDIYRLPFAMQVAQSFAFVDRGPAQARMDLALRRMRSADDAAVSLRSELSAAKDDVAAGRAGFGEHHLSILVTADNPESLDAATGEVQAALAETGFAVVREELGLEAAFWAQFPGNFDYIARRALVSTANFAGFASAHNFPVGRPSGNHWGDAVTLFETTAAGPYFFNFHRGDLGNFTVIGPSGSGKTVVLSFLLAQARRFDPRIIFFDKDRGAEIFLRAIGGSYEALRPGEPTRMNPLALPDTPTNRRFLAEWLARLAPWHSSGEFAWLFDNEEDRIDLATPTLGFDMTAILDQPALRAPTMLYLFHRVEERLDGKPTIIVVDEGWKALDDEVFVARIRDWEKTIRKRGGIVGFATQSASDALESRIASAIIEQAGTQIFMANSSAQASDYITGFGLTETEYDIVRSMPETARAFLVKHGTDSVVVRLNLRSEPHLLTVLSGRESSVRLLDRLRAEVGDEPAKWLPQLLAAA